MILVMAVNPQFNSGCRDFRAVKCNLPAEKVKNNRQMLSE
jgi:hypothetical protein